MHNSSFFFFSFLTVSLKTVLTRVVSCRFSLHLTMLTKPATKAPLCVIMYISKFTHTPYSHVYIFIQIRIDSSGTQQYTQFDAKPHPPMKPMAYSSGGLQSLLM
jgi:hypothetical protein